MKLIGYSLLMLAVWLVGYVGVGNARAQAGAQNDVPPATHIHSTEARLALKDIQVLVSKRSVAEANFKLFSLQAKQAETEYSSLTTRLNVQIEDLYHDLKLSKADYDINLETGELIPTKKTLEAK